jgi:hypothetical protein
MTRTKKNQNLEEDVSWESGGICSMLEIVEILSKAVEEPDRRATLIERLKPIVLEGEDEEKLLLDFSIMKICFRIAKLGKGLKHMYNKLDKDKNNTLDPWELVEGLGS